MALTHNEKRHYAQMLADWESIHENPKSSKLVRNYAEVKIESIVRELAQVVGIDYLTVMDEIDQLIQEILKESK